MTISIEFVDESCENIGGKKMSTPELTTNIAPVYIYWLWWKVTKQPNHITLVQIYRKKKNSTIYSRPGYAVLMICMMQNV